MRASSLVFIAVVVVVGCGTSRGADAPLSAGAAAVKVVGEADPGCKKIGSVTGVGRDLDEAKARTQAVEGAQEEAAKMGAGEMVLRDETTDMESANGGSAYRITKVADVFECAKAAPK